MTGGRSRTPDPAHKPFWDAWKAVCKEARVSEAAIVRSLSRSRDTGWFYEQRRTGETIPVDVLRESALALEIPILDLLIALGLVSLSDVMVIARRLSTNSRTSAGDQVIVVRYGPS